MRAEILGSFARAEEVFVRALSLLERWTRLSGRRDSTVEWVPTVDISETDGEYLLKSRLLAVRNEGVRVAYHNGMLTITNERKHENRKRRENFDRLERFSGTFSRSFALPQAIDAKAIRADAKDGMVTVHVPKSQVEAKKRAEIKTAWIAPF